MARVVFCARKRQEAEGLEAPPMFGKVGQEIFDHVSKEAWSEWQDMQLKIVNEYRLDLSEKNARQMLLRQMRVFLGLDDEGDMLHVGTPTDPSPHTR